MKPTVNIDDLEQMERELQAELKTVREFKQLLLKRAQPENGTAKKPQSVEGQAEAETQRKRDAKPKLGEVDEAVRKVIAAMSGTFTATDVETALAGQGHSFNRSSIFTVVSKMKDAQAIKVVEPGAGRRATKYKR